MESRLKTKKIKKTNKQTNKPLLYTTLIHYVLLALSFKYKICMLQWSLSLRNTSNFHSLWGTILIASNDLFFITSKVLITKSKNFPIVWKLLQGAGQMDIETPKIWYYQQPSGFDYNSISSQGQCFYLLYTKKITLNNTELVEENKEWLQKYTHS